VRVIPEENKIVGYTTKNSGGVPENFRNYFVIVFDKPFTYRATFTDQTLHTDKLEQTAGHTGAVIGFRTEKGEIVHARVASSFISECETSAAFCAASKSCSVGMCQSNI